MKKAIENKYFGRDLEAMSFAVNYHSWIVEEFRPFLGAKLAEVGAGTGNFTSMLLNENIKHLCAFEPSSNMYAILENRFKGNNKIEISSHYFSEVYKKHESHFDSIIYVNVLEHIKEDEQELSYVRSSLKEGGYFLGFVPALSWLYSDLDKKLGHIRRYKKQELVQLIEKSGFEIIKVKYFDMAGIVPWFIAFVLLNKTITGAKVTLYDKVVVPLMKNIEGIIPPPLGKNILLIAKKLTINEANER